MPYKFADQKIERELSEFDGDDVGQVADEIRICKVLIRRAVEQQNAGLANALLSTLAKLATTQVANAVRCGQLLERSELFKLGQELSAALISRLAGISNYDHLVDDLLDDFARIFSTRKQPLQLTHEQPAGTSESRDAAVLPLGKLE
jgi:hypothetical protein